MHLNQIYPCLVNQDKHSSRLLILGTSCILFYTSWTERMSLSHKQCSVIKLADRLQNVTVEITSSNRNSYVQSFFYTTRFWDSPVVSCFPVYCNLQKLKCKTSRDHLSPQILFFHPCILMVFIIKLTRKWLNKYQIINIALH